MEATALTVAVVVTIGITDIAKKVGLPVRFAPLFSLVIGVLATFLFMESISWSIVAIGVVTGLTASGAYSGAKATFSKK